MAEAASVLVIDDCAGVRTVMRLILSQAGYTVREAADGQEGLRSFTEQPADLVLCDLFMGELDGPGTVRGLQKHCPGARVVLMSGTGEFLDGHDVADCLGAAATLAKPFSVADLLGVVGQVLGSG